MKINISKIKQTQYSLKTIIDKLLLTFLIKNDTFFQHVLQI